MIAASMLLVGVVTTSLRKSKAAGPGVDQELGSFECEDILIVEVVKSFRGELPRVVRLALGMRLKRDFDNRRGSMIWVSYWAPKIPSNEALQVTGQT